MEFCPKLEIYFHKPVKLCKDALFAEVEPCFPGISIPAHLGRDGGGGGHLGADVVGGARHPAQGRPQHLLRPALPWVGLVVFNSP